MRRVALDGGLSAKSMRCSYFQKDRTTSDLRGQGELESYYIFLENVLSSGERFEVLYTIVFKVV